MKKNRGKMVLYASVVCMVSVAALLGGMGCYAVQEGNHTEALAAEKETEPAGTKDVLSDVIAGEDAARGEEMESGAGNKIANIGKTDVDFSAAKIMTWDDYYALGSDAIKEQVQGDGIKGTLGVNDLSMEKAGQIGLEEIARVYEDDLEGLMVMMVLINDASGQSMDIWDGYVTNYVNGEEMQAERPQRSYHFTLNAVTGEMRSLSTANDELMEENESAANALTDEEIVKIADSYVEKLGLADLSKVRGEIVTDYSYTFLPTKEDNADVGILEEAYEIKAKKTPSVIFYTISDGMPALKIDIWRNTGKLKAYQVL